MLQKILQYMIVFDDIIVILSILCELFVIGLLLNAHAKSNVLKK